MKLVWFLGLLVFCYGVFSNGVSRTLPSRPANVSIGAIFTLNSTIGRIAKIAIELAVEDVNSNPSILGGTKLQVKIMDSNCSGFLGIIEGNYQQSLIFLSMLIQEITGCRFQMLSSLIYLGSVLMYPELQVI